MYILQLQSCYVGNCVCMYWNLCCLVKLPVPSNTTGHVMSLPFCSTALRSLTLVPWVYLLLVPSLQDLHLYCLCPTCYLLSEISPLQSQELTLHASSQFPAHLICTCTPSTPWHTVPVWDCRWLWGIVKAFCGRFLVELCFYLARDGGL